MSKREKVLLAVLGSILAHILLLLLVGFAVSLRPPPPPAPPDEPLTVQYAEPTPEPPQIDITNAKPPPPPFLDTSARPPSEKPPDQPAFESNQDTLAASEEPASGDSLLPSQKGKKTPVFAFDTQVYTPGTTPAVPEQKAAPPVDTTPPKPQVNREAPRPTPVPTPEPTPPPAATPADDEFAMLQFPTPVPRKRDDPTPFDPFARPNPGPAPQPLAPGARRPPTPGYQPQTARNEVSGAISNRGPSSVAAIGTPLGKYQKAVSDAVGSRWYMYVEQHFDLPINGIVKIQFTIERSGKVRKPHITSQTGNQTLATLSIGAIMDATIPPIPPDVLSIINSNELVLDYSFYLE